MRAATARDDGGGAGDGHIGEGSRTRIKEADLREAGSMLLACHQQKACRNLPACYLAPRAPGAFCTPAKMTTRTTRTTRTVLKTRIRTKIRTEDTLTTMPPCLKES